MRCRARVLGDGVVLISYTTPKGLVQSSEDTYLSLRYHKIRYYPTYPSHSREGRFFYPRVDTFPSFLPLLYLLARASSDQTLHLNVPAQGLRRLHYL